MPVAIIGAVIGAGASVYAASKQSSAMKEQANAQRDASEAQSRSASVQAARERMKQIREARIRSGAISNTAGGAGMGQQSSGVAGSISSIGSQTGANIGAINVTQGFAESASSSLQAAADAGVDAQKWQMISSTASGISGSLFKQAGGWDSIFGANTIKGVK